MTDLCTCGHTDDQHSLTGLAKCTVEDCPCLGFFEDEGLSLRIEDDCDADD